LTSPFPSAKGKSIVTRQNFSTAMILGACVALSACTDNSPAPETTATTAAAPAATDAAPAAATAGAAGITPWTVDLGAAPTSQLCALDAINGVVAVDGKFSVAAGKPATLAGWVSTTTMQAPPSFSIVLIGDSNYQVAGNTGATRTDVAQAYKTDQLTTAGFEVSLANVSLPAGDYKVSIAHQENGGWVGCETKEVVSVN
jgi:hypothetical protein